MLKVETTALLIVDIQEKLTRAMHEKEALVENSAKMIKGAQILGVPIIASEQNPQGLGPTIPELAELLSGAEAVSKVSFSCCGEDRFMAQFKALNRKQVLVAGIEAHVCVYQTAADLLNLGYEVQVLADCVSSRTPENKAIGLELIKNLGGTLTSAETAIFELMKVAEGDTFKQMLKVVK